MTTFAPVLQLFEALPCPFTVSDVARWPGEEPPTPEQEGATLALLDAILTQDLDRVEQALDDGACVNVTLAQTNWPTPKRSLPPTVLGLALWVVQEITDHDLDVSDHEADDGTIVARLLAAGAEPLPTMVARFEHEEDHLACQALQQAVLDRMGDGQALPGTIMTLDGRKQAVANSSDGTIESVLPWSGSHGPHLWLHRAVEFDHLPAMKAWFAGGGVVGTGDSESVVSLLWLQTINDHRSEHTPVWTAMLDVLRPHLLAEPSYAIYHKEVMATLVRYARAGKHFTPDDPVMEQCLAWVEGLVRERPLRNYALHEIEAFALDVQPGEHALINASLARLERADLRSTLALEPLPAGAARPRL